MYQYLAARSIWFFSKRTSQEGWWHMPNSSMIARLMPYLREQSHWHQRSTGGICSEGMRNPAKSICGTRTTGASWMALVEVLTSVERNMAVEEAVTAVSDVVQLWAAALCLISKTLTGHRKRLDLGCIALG